MTVDLLECRPHSSKRAIHTQLIYGIQSLFQSLNIEVQDVSPDLLPVMTVIPPTSTVTRGIRDISYVKGNRYHFSRLVFLVSRRKNGLKRDQFNTLLIDRKERFATYKCSTVYSL